MEVLDKTSGKLFIMNWIYLAVFYSPSASHEDMTAGATVITNGSEMVLRMKVTWKICWAEKRQPKCCALWSHHTYPTLFTFSHFSLFRWVFFFFLCLLLVTKCNTKLIDSAPSQKTVISLVLFSPFFLGIHA